MSESTPLKGRRIVVTRNLEAASRLSHRLEALGAEVLELPLIEIIQEGDVLRAGDVFAEIAHYEWILFTSANGVRGFFDLFLKAFDDIRSLGFARLAAIGERTASAIREWHLRVDLCPETATAEGLATALAEEQTLDNLKILVVTGNRNRKDLVQFLESQNAITDTLEVYRTELADLSSSPAAADFRKNGADAVIFASSSSVISFGHQADHLALQEGAKVPALASFGPQTSAAMKGAGIPVAIEAAEPGLDSMVAAVVEYFEDHQ